MFNVVLPPAPSCFKYSFLGILTDVNRAKQYSNIDDWEGTLMLTRLGLKYQKYDFQQSEKAFEEEMRRQLGGNDNGKLQ